MGCQRLRRKNGMKNINAFKLGAEYSSQKGAVLAGPKRRLLLFVEGGAGTVSLR
jgi:hypothetical protein